MSRFASAPLRGSSQEVLAIQPPSARQERAKVVPGLADDGVEMGHGLFERGIIEGPALDRRQRAATAAAQPPAHPPRSRGGPAAAAVRIGPVRRLHDVAAAAQTLQPEQPPLRAMRDLDRDLGRHQRVKDAGSRSSPRSQDARRAWSRTAPGPRPAHRRRRVVGSLRRPAMARGP